MKWLIILVLLLIVLALIALRYRRQIQTGLQLYKMFRQMRQASKPIEKKQPETARVADKNENLVRCARCGKWLSQSSALNLRSKTSYCSAVCMEKAAKIESLVDRQ